MKKLKEELENFLQNRYGLDELGKNILYFSSGICIIGIAAKNYFLSSVSVIGFIYAFYRVFSKKLQNRAEENWRFCRYLKLWNIRYQERKTSRIFMCSKCGRYIRIPKKKGKVQITCPSCGNKFLGRS